MAWHRVITHNLGWKAVSVILATVVWLLVHYNSTEIERPQEIRTFDAVPIVVLTPANDPYIFLVEPPSVRVAVRGPESLIKVMRASDVKVFVDLIGVSQLVVRRDVEVRLPEGISLASLYPNEVKIERLSSDPLPNPLTTDKP